MRPKIVIIEGADGTGKSHLTKALFPELDFKYIIVDRFAVSSFVYDEMSKLYTNSNDFPVCFRRKKPGKLTLGNLSAFMNELSSVFQEVHLILLTASIDVLRVRRPLEPIGFLQKSQDLFVSTVCSLLSEKKTYDIRILDTTDTNTKELAQNLATLIVERNRSYYTKDKRTYGEIDQEVWDD